jgi:ATP-dependent Clp protease ATP-binding subunit ClpB
VVTEEARNQIADAGYDPTYGARPLKRVIQQRLQNPLATELLKGEFTSGSAVKIDFRQGDFRFEQCGSDEMEPQIDTAG